MPPTSDLGDPEETWAAVTTRYSSLARAARSGQQIIDCGPDAFEAGCFGAAGYGNTSGLPDGAVRASLGCGNPVAVAQLHPGQTVLDLGSGGGIDVLLSARRVAPGGKAYGLDGSPDMIALAQENAAQAGVTNVEFLHGRIEAIPLPEASVDVVISNCVINLSPAKPRVLAEAFRVLRPGGRLGVSDIIADEDLDPTQRTDAERQSGCTTGTLTAAEYRRLLLAAGFTAITITATSDAAPGLHSAIVQATRPAASAPRCSMPSSARPRPMGSGPSRPASSPRTRPACGSTSRPGSASSAPGSGSAVITAAGGTSPSSNAAAPPPGTSQSSNGLARPVGPEQREDGPARHRQVDVIEHYLRAERLAQPGHLMPGRDGPLMLPRLASRGLLGAPPRLARRAAQMSRSSTAGCCAAPVPASRW